MNALIADRLGKAYRSYGSELRRVASWFGLKNGVRAEEWVLRHISFAIRSGEAVGIVGENGAGKSTLLKLITGTLRPSEGQVHIGGRISAILELGMGFNPELTGRQNARHSLGLMGFPQKQIEDLIPQIQDFSEIGHWFDAPLRTYSSGMQARIAFAVASAVRPDILIIDEALSVGDTYFQHKSFARIQDFRKMGTTLLIVSHDKSAIQTLCNRAILLEKGRILQDGDPQAVLDYYNALIAERENSTVEVRALEDNRLQTLSGTGEAGIHSISLHNGAGDPVEFVGTGDPVCLRVCIEIRADIPELVVGYMIKDRLGQAMYGTNTHNLACPLMDLKAAETLECRFRFNANLGPGSYSVALALHTGETHLEHNYEWRDMALLFQVANLSRPLFGGVNWIPTEVEYIR